VTSQITGVFQKITRKPWSHTHGWSQSWSENLGIPINYDNEPVEEIFVDHGVNFGGSLNLFGGYEQKLEDRIKAALKAERVWSLDIDMPDYAGMLAARKDAPSAYLLALLQEWQRKAKTLRSIDLALPWLTTAWAPHNSMVVKENGKTLYGQASTGFPYVREHLERCPWLQGVTMVFGNIDVRHHLCRLGTEWRDIFREWKRFGDSLGIKVEYSLPWPVEFEGRKLPKTGWYRGQPFWGSQAERAELVQQIHSFMEGENMVSVKFPTQWFDLSPEEYAKERMERPQSVHLSPQFYRRHCEWPVHEVAR
jgi:hypothetical protein